MTQHMCSSCYEAPVSVFFVGFGGLNLLLSPALKPSRFLAISSAKNCILGTVMEVKHIREMSVDLQYTY